MIPNNNHIPKPLEKLISLAVVAFTGAEAEGPGVPLKTNTAPEIGTDLHDVIGDPLTPLIPGKQDKYAAQKAVVSAKFAAARVAKEAGRAYCLAALGVLRPVLGNRWNAQWNAAGFVTPSLAVPRRDPVVMLIRFRQYFNANPAQEVAARSVTAAIAQARITAIQQTTLAVTQARDLLLNLQGERDAAVETLRARLIGLRNELDQALEDDDGRWYDFGFRRPIDGRMPDLVTGLVLTPLGAGVVSAAWDLATLAENYRVTWRVTGGSSPITELGLFADRQCTITGLPSGSSVVVGVTARNDSGETAPTEAVIVVP
jgi:hypothetical protein